MRMEIRNTNPNYHARASKTATCIVKDRFGDTNCPLTASRRMPSDVIFRLPVCANGFSLLIARARFHARNWTYGPLLVNSDVLMRALCPLWIARCTAISLAQEDCTSEKQGLCEPHGYVHESASNQRVRRKGRHVCAMKGTMHEKRPTHGRHKGCRRESKQKSEQMIEAVTTHLKQNINHK